MKRMLIVKIILSILILNWNVLLSQKTILAEISIIKPVSKKWCQLSTFSPEPKYSLYNDGTFRLYDIPTSTIGQGNYRIKQDTISFEFTTCNYQQSQITFCKVDPKLEGIKLRGILLGGNTIEDPLIGAKIIIKQDSLGTIDTLLSGFNEIISLKYLNLNNPFSIEIIYDGYDKISIELPFWHPTDQLEILLGYNKKMIRKEILNGEKLIFTFEKDKEYGYLLSEGKRMERRIFMPNKKFETLKKIISKYH